MHKEEREVEHCSWKPTQRNWNPSENSKSWIWLGCCDMKNSMAMLVFRITQSYREARLEISYLPVLQTMAFPLLWEAKTCLCCSWFVWFSFKLHDEGGEVRTLTGCSCIGPWFSSQHPHGRLQPSVASVLKIPMPSGHWGCTYINVGKRTQSIK